MELAMMIDEMNEQEKQAMIQRREYNLFNVLTISENKLNAELLRLGVHITDAGEMVSDASGDARNAGYIEGFNADLKLVGQMAAIMLK